MVKDTAYKNTRVKFCVKNSKIPDAGNMFQQYQWK